MTRHCLGHYEMYRFSVFALVVGAARVNVVYIFAVLHFVFHDLFVSSFCLYDETEHYAVMFFVGCPCSRWVAYRRSYCCVEQSETVFEQIVFRCQLLSVLVKRRPGCPDTKLDFGRFLLLECNLLIKISILISSICISFFESEHKLLWLLRTFVPSWVDPESHFFSTFLEVFSDVVFIGIVYSFRDLFVSSCRLYDEAKHFELCRLNHSFTLFCECPSSRGVTHRWQYHCVEKPKSASKPVCSRCQL